jgi:hypothetical protein
MQNSSSVAGQTAPLPIERTKRSTSSALLWACAVAVVAVATGDWLSIKTQRLYLDQRHDPSQTGTISQRFAKRKKQVTPEIISSGEARFSFQLASPPRSNLFLLRYQMETARLKSILSTAERNINSRPLRFSNLLRALKRAQT